MVKTSRAWEWVKPVQEAVVKTHPTVQCKFCDKIIRNCQLGRDLLPHARSKCPQAPADVKEAAREEMEKAAEAKKKRKPSGGAAPQRAKKPKHYLSASDDDMSDGEDTGRSLKKTSYFMTPYDPQSDDEEGIELERSASNFNAADSRKVRITLGRLLNSIGMSFSELQNDLFTHLMSLGTGGRLPTPEELEEVMPQRTHKVPRRIQMDQFWAMKQRMWDANEEDEDME